MRKSSLTLAGFLLAISFQVSAQPGHPPCYPEGINADLPLLRRANLVYLRFNEDTFPDTYVNPRNRNDQYSGIRQAMKAAMTAGAVRWNQNCNPAPLLNDQPVLIPVPAGFEPPAGIENTMVVDVKYIPDFSPEREPCVNQQGYICSPRVAATFFYEGRIEIIIYGKSDRIDAPSYTLVDFWDVFRRLFLHELGHVLLLDHDTCFKSPMRDAPDRRECSPNNPDCEPEPDPEHCNQMDSSFEPADPLDAVLAHDPGSLCRLRYYCDRNFTGALMPWARIRSGCVWIQDVAQTTVSSYDEDGQPIGSAVRTYTSYRCLGPEANFGPAMTSSSSPFLMVGFPKPGTVADSGFIKLSGWVWGRGQDVLELRLFVDQQDAVFASFDYPVDSRALCSAGFDPGFCDSFGGFRGLVDIHNLSPGVHKLLVVATDRSDDPLPSHIELEFNVPETFINHPPTAQDDQIIITLIEGSGPETTLDLLANDSDIDGQPIELADNAIVTHPAQGTLTRLGTRQFVYRPFLWPTSSDSFRYQITDNLGASAVAEVRIRFMQSVILP